MSTISPTRVIVWNEFRVEALKPEAATLYPHGLHEAIAAPLRAHADLRVKTATLDEPEHGLSEAALADADVLIWWGHRAHSEVADAVVDRVQRHVLGGLGLILLHSAHASKPFQRLLGTSGDLGWRNATDKERLWNVLPAHPILAGIGPYIELAREEMYAEPFVIPTPDETLLISWFTGGEVFRSGCTWRRGNGRIFYFRPGHETYPTFHHASVQRVLLNASRWVRPTVRTIGGCVRREPLEPLPT